MHAQSVIQGQIQGQIQGSWHPPVLQGKLGLDLEECTKYDEFGRGAGPGPIGISHIYMFLRPAPPRLRTDLLVNNALRVNNAPRVNNALILRF